jgi:short-subunit dehydrogenase
MKVIITGGSSGIGKCLKKKFLKKGDTVIDFSRTNGFDITNHQKIADYVKKNVKDLDIFIHCAGFNSPMGVLEIKDRYKEWKNHHEINFLSFVFLSSLLDDKMNKGGVIMAISSRSAELTRKEWSGYCSSKAALNSFIKNYSQERDDIRVIGFSPSKVYTSMIKKLYPDIKEKDCLDPRNVADEIMNIIENDSLTGTIHTYVKT